MSSEDTVFQSPEEQQKARELSSKPRRPPAEIPGYDVQRFIGAGTYGQVWAGSDLTTGRTVAIKFYTHYGDLDLPLLAREVENLAFLAADRYVVQLLDVGWDADPPYYVMEYVESGSLQDYLDREGPLTVRRIVEIMREIAVGLTHAHSKGVLHCDLKRGNVLMDQDGKPRLADFGQARLTHDQASSLGTLFFMAPEQADLKAVPDVRWDVYALGALFYQMLTGDAPYRSDQPEDHSSETDLRTRLRNYRKLLQDSPKPNAHRNIPGVDKALASIIDHCLETNPKHRYSSVQEIVQDLDLWTRRRARQPLVFMASIGPVLLFVVLTLFAFLGLRAMLDPATAALTERALESNRFAATYVASKVQNDLENRLQAVEQLASDLQLQKILRSLIDDPDTKTLFEKLSDPTLPESIQSSLREEYRAILQFNEGSLPNLLQRKLLSLGSTFKLSVASLFITGPKGNAIARSPFSYIIGRNYAWRTYFHGGAEDFPPTWRPLASSELLTKAQISAFYMSQATQRWTVGISSPIKDLEDDRFLGVIVLTFEIGRIVELQAGPEQFPVLVNRRLGKHRGLILQHPILSESDRYPNRFMDPVYYVTDDRFPVRDEIRTNYRDPMASAPEGMAFDKRWLAEHVPILVDQEDTGWAVIVQQSYDDTIGRTLEKVAWNITWIYTGLFATIVATLSFLVWWSFTRVTGRPRYGFGRSFDAVNSESNSFSMTSSLAVSSRSKVSR